MNAIESDTRAALIQAARELSPRIRALSDQIDQERRLPRAIVDAMSDAGLFHMAVPRNLGGAEVEPETFIRVVEEVARIDGSVGWCLMIGAGAAVFSGYLPESSARDIFAADRGNIVAGYLGASGRATIVPDGYRLSGRWSFGSGILHSTWVTAGAIVYEGDEPRLLPDGRPDVRQFFFPTAECEIIDTWSVVGLRGTGSNDFAARDVFVPREYSIVLGDHPVQGGPLYAFPLFSLLTSCLAAVPLGIARGAIDALVSFAATKVPTGSQQPLRHRLHVQSKIAQAEALLGAARAFFLEALSAAWQDLVAGQPLALQKRAMLRLAAVHASASAAQAVDLVYSAGGSNSIYASNLLERAFRDAHTATQHVMVQPVHYEAVGRALLGLEPAAVPPL